MPLPWSEPSEGEGLKCTAPRGQNISRVFPLGGDLWPGFIPNFSRGPTLGFMAFRGGGGGGGGSCWSRPCTGAPNHNRYISPPGKQNMIEVPPRGGGMWGGDVPVFHLPVWKCLTMEGILCPYPPPLGPKF